MSWDIIEYFYGFKHISTFPNFHISCADFPNSEGPAPIPKILKRNTVFTNFNCPLRIQMYPPRVMMVTLNAHQLSSTGVIVDCFSKNYHLTVHFNVLVIDESR